VYKRAAAAGSGDEAILHRIRRKGPCGRSRSASNLPAFPAVLHVARIREAFGLGEGITMFGRSEIDGFQGMPRGITRAGVVLLAILIAIAAPVAHAAVEVCVSNANELEQAMAAAQSSPRTIELVQGTYGTGFEMPVSAGTSLRGGYNPGCTSRDIALGNTMITQHTELDPMGDLTIEGLTWYDLGINHDTDFDPDVPAGSEILLRRDAFINGGGINIQWQADDDDVTIRIVDTVVANAGGGNFPAVLLGATNDDSLTFELINNTIVDNPDGSGVRAYLNGSGATLYAYNNILYGNSGYDLIADDNFLVLVDNVIGTSSYPTPFFPPIGTQTGNPRLDANYRPIESPPSPVINTGTTDVRGGLPATDLPGRARVVGTEPDRGAYESSINDAFLQTVSSTSDSGAGSLRSAIVGANAHGSGLITFDIGSGCGPHVITLNSPLPSITAPVIINGFSQTGASANDLDVGDDASLCVILESGSASVTRGLVVPASAGNGASLFVEGLALSNFSDAAIDLGAGSGHLIVGNRFGGNASGHTLLPNGIGVQLDAAAHDSTVGGDDDGARNILGSSTGSGIALFQGTHDNQIIGNLVGVGWSGDASGHFTNLGNGTRGVYLAGHDNEISGNWIGDNAQAGIAVANGGATGNTIEDNRIGFAWGTTGPYGNGQAGVHFEGNQGDAPGPNRVLDNVIVFNGTQGVWVEIGQGNKVRRNSIGFNGGLGIDLVDAGVLPNDNDAASEPPDYANRGLNYPAPITAAGGFASGTFSGSLESTLGTYRIDFYQTLSGCDPNDKRQGQYWIGSTLITISTGMVGGDGVADFSVLLHAGNYPVLPGGAGITATATDTSGNTSEYSACVPYLNDTIFADGFEPLI
jgi:hypothetical protein